MKSFSSTHSLANHRRLRCRPVEEIAVLRARVQELEAGQLAAAAVVQNITINQTINFVNFGDVRLDDEQKRRLIAEAANPKGLLLQGASVMFGNFARPETITCFIEGSYADRTAAVHHEGRWKKQRVASAVGAVCNTVKDAMGEEPLGLVGENKGPATMQLYGDCAGEIQDLLERAGTELGERGIKPDLSELPAAD